MSSYLEPKIESLNTGFKSFEASISQLEGQKHVLHTQIKEARSKFLDLETTKALDEKAIVVLNLVQKSTREAMKDAFEKTVTFALQSIYQDKYEFVLDFNTRGNLGTLDFKLKSPKNKGFLDLEECAAGGSLDIISIALRFVLLQVMRPRVEGFCLLDEPAKMLRGQGNIENLFNFFEQMNKKLGRQLIIIPPTDSTDMFVKQNNWIKIKIG